jgi:hypothetical protein
MARETFLARSNLGNAVKEYGRDHPAVDAARQDLETAKLADKARALVEDWPTFTDDQRHRVASILQSILDNDFGDAA